MRITLLACMIGATWALSGCGHATALPAAQAVAHYDAAMTAARTAMKPLVPTYRDISGRHVTADSRRCTYAAVSESALRGQRFLFGEAGWEPVKASLNEALVANGFAAVDKPQLMGAEQILITRDAHDAELRMSGNGDLWISGALVDAPACTSAALGLS